MPSRAIHAHSHLPISNWHPVQTSFHQLWLPNTGHTVGWGATCWLVGKRWSYPITGLDRPSGLQEVQASRISTHWAHEGGKVARPTHRPHLLPRRYPWYLFLLELSSRYRSCYWTLAGKICHRIGICIHLQGSAEHSFRNTVVMKWAYQLQVVNGPAIKWR